MFSVDDELLMRRVGRLPLKWLPEKEMAETMSGKVKKEMLLSSGSQSKDDSICGLRIFLSVEQVRKII